MVSSLGSGWKEEGKKKEDGGGRLVEPHVAFTNDTLYPL